MKQVLILLLLVASLGSRAQTKILTPAELLTIVRDHHPLARQAALQTDIARADILSARGGFDPVFRSENGRKELDGLLYYNQSNTEVRIPTWYGVDIVAGTISTSGARTNPVDTKGASSYVGFNIPLAKNLLMDSRRAALRQANIFHRMSFAEQREALNNLAIDALKSYWNWWEQYNQYQLFTSAMKNAQSRLTLVKTSYFHGERPAIDTLEALTQLQTFIQRQSELEMEVQNAQLQLSGFLWVNGEQPYDLPREVVPQQSAQPLPELLHSVEKLLEASQNHPQLEQYKLKLDALEIERRLKFQSLLPSVNLKYNQLTKSHDLTKAITSAWLQDNYRYGIGISIPLRLSEGRGQYQKAKLKIEQTRLDQNLKEVLVRNKVRQYYNEWKQLGQQVQLQQQTVVMLQQLQRGEELRFANGESSLFLINSREAKTLEAMQKLIETRGKLQKAANQVIWASGQLMQ